MSSVDKLRAFYPEFASVTAFPDATITVFIEAAAEEISDEVWDTLYVRGALALAAHMLALAKRSTSNAGASISAGGAIASMGTGEESISFATGSGTADQTSLQSTIYGQEYLRLEAKVSGSPIYTT